MENFLRWFIKNGKSIEFLKSLKNRGRKTALDNLPNLDLEEVELWDLYCAVGSGGLISLDVYTKRIGLPHGWTFNECFTLINNLESLRNKLQVKDG